MIWFIGFAAARLAVAAFCLLTAAYAALNCSPFAFDMFIRPQLFPWITQFVGWHHLWCLAAYSLSILTLVDDLDWRVRRDGSARAAHWLAVAYAGVFGAVAAVLLLSPFLPRLWNDNRALPTAFVALAPLVWLAAIDHLSVHAAGRPWRATTPPAVGQRRLLITCAILAGYLWASHVARAAATGEVTGHAAEWVLTSLWTLTLTAAGCAFVYTVLSLKAAIAACTRAPWWWQHILASALVAASICEFLRRAVLPTVSLGAIEAASVAAMGGISLAALWAGLVIRRPWTRPPGFQAAGQPTFAWKSEKPAIGISLLVLAYVSSWTLNHIARLDWAFVGQRLVLLAEGVVAFSLALGATRHVVEQTWSIRAAIVPPLTALALLIGVPHAALRLATSTGDRALEPTAAFDRHAAADPLFKFASDGLVARAGFDGDYYRFLQFYTDASKASITIPDIEFPRAKSRLDGPRPDIFVFVIDSLRRDYLSSYNSAVTFTPMIERFAADSFVFRNAFTRHGATQLAAPSIWAGAAVFRRVLAPGFDRMNALEKFVNAEGYRIAINDFTVAPYLRPTTPSTTIDPDVLSVDTDLCRNLDDLSAHLDASTADSKPVFGYLSPMNLHILNTRRGGQQSLDGDYPGFYAPYASRLKRIDACFGSFVSYLNQRGRFNNSIIVLTSDHGDSLGEDGYWGHATWLFPEVARVPLIVHLPPSLRDAITTDVAQVAFTSDIMPTLYALRGHPVDNANPLIGSTLFVPKGATMPDRRRSSFLVTSSYGAAFGLLRRNGHQFYVTDLVERREFAYELSERPAPAVTQVGPEVRRTNEREIRAQVAASAAFYRFRK